MEPRVAGCGFATWESGRLGGIVQNRGVVDSELLHLLRVGATRATAPAGFVNVGRSGSAKLTGMETGPNATSAINSHWLPLVLRRCTRRAHARSVGAGARRRLEAMWWRWSVLGRPQEAEGSGACSSRRGHVHGVGMCCTVLLCCGAEQGRQEHAPVALLAAPSCVLAAEPHSRYA